MQGDGAGGAEDSAGSLCLPPVRARLPAKRPWLKAAPGDSTGRRDTGPAGRGTLQRRVCCPACGRGPQRPAFGEPSARLRPAGGAAGTERPGVLPAARGAVWDRGQPWGVGLSRDRGRALPTARRGSTGSLWRSGCSLRNWSSLILREAVFTDRVLIDLTS